ncbi:FUSC family protein [Streptomyces sp. NPDC002054]|uniref:FUSC family protein n=1 Tax=Streptomyces sp. NPDC002054 TaxID=3154663 RepID=UPI003322D8B8
MPGTPSAWNRALRERVAPAARLVVCAAVPWYLCVWLGTSTAPVPAALPAVLILRADLFAAPRLALERLVGVVVGVLLSVTVLHWLPVSSASFMLVLVCGTAGMYLMRHDGSPNQQVLITALMIYTTPAAGYPLARLVESAVGIAVVALLGPLLWPPDPYREAAAGLEAYRTDLAARLERISGQLRTTPASTSSPAPGGRAPESFALWHRPYELSAALDVRARRLHLPAAPPDGLRDRLRLAGRTALSLQYFTRELEVWPPAADPGDRAVRELAPVLEATARALDTALRGGDHSAELRRAMELEAAHRAAHPGSGDALLRSGLHLTHQALAGQPPAPGP